jgi:NADPH-dependent 2,4-dienoyl-CoA reductase/sulfur reductase-like enzyme
MHSSTRTAAVVGAGGLGLAAMKNLVAVGFDVTGYDLADEVGGNWYIDGPTSRVYESTHTISTKPFTQYPDFPMPDEWPDYPHQRQMGEYLRRYADHFDLRRRIRFCTEVVRVEPVDPSDPATAWDVTARGPDGVTTTDRVDVVVVANGHNWRPKVPDVPGDFAGEVMHSAQYKSAEVLRGRRVLVVGAGNTGCDIAVEAAQQARSVLHSTRRGYWYAPKYAFGRPADQINDLITGLRTPMWLKQRLMHATIRLTVGDHAKLGLPAPDHAILETHPIANSLLPYYVGQGDITPVPDVERFAGDRVVFTDGSEAEVDLVVFATGYLAEFPFLDPDVLDWRDGRPNLALNMVPERYDTIAVAGLYQPDSGVFAIAHWQGVLVAELFDTVTTSPPQARQVRSQVLHPLRQVTSESRELSGGVRFARSTRRFFEVSHQEYLRALDRTIDAVRRTRAAAA